MMRQLRLTGGMAILALFSACGGQGRYPTSMKPETNLVLSGSPCVVSDPLQIREQKGKQATWHVTNNCSGSYRVRIQNFSKKNDDGTTDAPSRPGAVLESDPETKAIAPGARDDAKAKLVADPGGAPVTYKYEIWVDDGTGYKKWRDPDLEIWP